MTVVGCLKRAEGGKQEGGLQSSKQVSVSGEEETAPYFFPWGSEGADVSSCAKFVEPPLKMSQHPSGFKGGNIAPACVEAITCLQCTMPGNPVNRRFSMRQCEIQTRAVPTSHATTLCCPKVQSSTDMVRSCFSVIST
jgi:hypothetical protein